MKSLTVSNRKVMIRKPISWIGFLLLLFFFFYPIGKLLWLSVDGLSGPFWQHYTELLQEKKTWRTLQQTLYIVGGATLFSIVAGTIVAWMVAYSDIRGKKIIGMLVMLSFIIPSYISSLSWIQLMAPDGWLVTLLKNIFGMEKPFTMYSMGGIILVMGLHHYPLVYLMAVTVLRKIPRELELASRLSGAGKWQTFTSVTLPLATPGIIGGGFLAFLASLDNFGIPAFLGIPANITVLSTQIYEEVVGFGPSAFARAAALSVLLGLLAAVGTGIQWLFMRKSGRMETHQEDYTPRFSLGRYRTIIEWLFYAAVLVATFIPLISMAATSFVRAYGLPFTGENLTLEHYRFLLMDSPKVHHALVNSFMLAGITAVICLVIGTAIAYERVRRPSLQMKAVEVILGLPYALPGVVFALSMILVWIEPIPGWNPGIYGSMTILFLAYVIRFMILQVRGSMTAILQVDRSVEEAARVSGAGGYSKWRQILLPLFAPSMLSGALLVFLTALTELTVSSLLWSTGSETLGVVIFGFEQAGSTTHSTAMSTLVVVFIIVGFLGLQGIRKMGSGRGTNDEYRDSQP